MIVICNKPSTHVSFVLTTLSDLSCHNAGTCCAIYYKNYDYGSILGILHDLISNEGCSILVSPATFCYGGCNFTRVNAIGILQDLLPGSTTFKSSLISTNLKAIYLTEKHFLLIHKYDKSVTRLSQREVECILTLTQIFDHPLKEKLFTHQNWETIKQTLKNFFATGDPEVIQRIIELPKISKDKLKQGLNVQI